MIIMSRTMVGTTLFSVVLLLLTACVARLAPNYDKAIVDGLTSTNTKLMELFASTSSGTTKDTFDQREKTYNSLIGSLDALTIQSKARPIPKNKITDNVNSHLRNRGVQVLIGEEIPSSIAIEKISSTMVKMRDTDKKQGLTSTESSSFKGQVVIFLD